MIDFAYAFSMITAWVFGWAAGALVSFCFGYFTTVDRASSSAKEHDALFNGLTAALAFTMMFVVVLTAKAMHPPSI